MRNAQRTFLSIALALPLAVAPVTFASAAETTNPYGASSVDPAGPNEIIFTVSKGKKVSTFTASRLAKMKTSKISIYEPFVKKRQEFSVVPLKTFFDMVGIKSNDVVSTVALNDYIFDATAKKWLAANAYIAIKRNGADIPYDQGGPIRIVFADSSSWAKYLDAWNWSLKRVSVK